MRGDAAGLREPRGGSGRGVAVVCRDPAQRGGWRDFTPRLGGGWETGDLRFPRGFEGWRPAHSDHAAPVTLAAWPPERRTGDTAELEEGLPAVAQGGGDREFSGH